MDYVKLGRTGLDVSRICLGCLSFGEPDRGGHEWTLTEEKSRPLIRHALEIGINFFDTANIYSDGSSEEIVGRALKDMASRDEVVIATKVHGRMRPGPNGGGLSRRHILAEIDHSLKRLGTDHVDLYQIHRWDPETPLEETLEALHDVVKMGKARYLGASTMFAWQFAKALHLAEKSGWTRFVSMQNQVSLLHREEQREVMPLCADEGIAVLPWSPLARGLLSRPRAATSPRFEIDRLGKKPYGASAEADTAVIEAVCAVADRRGCPPAQVAIAWLLQLPTVTSPVIGATKASHLDDAVAAVRLKLTPEEVAILEAPYLPRPWNLPA